MDAKVNRPPTPKRPAPRIHTQECLFNGDSKPESEYTSKIASPIYEPKNRKPSVIELLDKSKANSLIRNIELSNVADDEASFLIEAAKRHNVFNYKLIADYYAHATLEMQKLMEESALVIIDFEDAIANGYVKFSEEVANIYVKEHRKP
jgi:hypothetical protein